MLLIEKTGITDKMGWPEALVIVNFTWAFVVVFLTLVKKYG